MSPPWFVLSDSQPPLWNVIYLQRSRNASQRRFDAILVQVIMGGGYVGTYKNTRYSRYIVTLFTERYASVWLQDWLLIQKYTFSLLASGSINTSSLHGLVAVNLDTKALRTGVTAVLDSPGTLFVGLHHVDSVGLGKQHTNIWESRARASTL